MEFCFIFSLFLFLLPFFLFKGGGKNGEMGDFVDHELLLSVASGIGRWVDGPSGAVYERDEDCLGEEKEEKSFDGFFLSF